MTSIQIDRTDGLVSSTAIKGPCRAATTANIALYGLQTIDGEALAAGDRVLVKGQTASYENGIYVCDTGQWRRSKDFSGNNDVRDGTQVLVAEGTLYERSLWCVTSDNPVIVGTNAITFQQTIVSPVELEALVAAAQAAAAAASDSADDAAAAAAAAIAAAAALAALNIPVASTGPGKALFAKGDGSGYELDTVNSSDITTTATDPLRITIGNIAYPERYGAVDRTGATDSSAAINAAIAGKKFVELGEGTLRINSKLSILASDKKLIGCGPGATQIVVYSTTEPAVEIADGLQRIEIEGLGISRSGTPGNVSASGIRCAGSVNLCRFSKIEVNGHYDGLFLRNTGYSAIEDSFIFDNLSDGIDMSNTATGGNALQWYIEKVLFQTNGERGIYAHSVVGPAAVALGDWTDIRSFANTGPAMAVVGLSGTPINGVRIRGGFVGEDNASEIYLNTYGYGHKIENIFAEICGTRSTGPGFGTPASHVGWGIEVTANNQDVKIADCYIQGNSEGGIKSSATVLTRITDSNINGNTGWGVLVADGSKTVVTDCDIYGNTTGIVSATANAAGLQQVGNGPGAQNTVLVGGVMLGNATGGVPTVGLINVASGMLKNNVAYNNP